MIISGEDDDICLAASGWGDELGHNNSVRTLAAYQSDRTKERSALRVAKLKAATWHIAYET